MTTLANPYLDEFKKIHNGSDYSTSRNHLSEFNVEEHASESLRRYKARDECVNKFACAVPTNECIEKIATLSPLVSIAAGAGYWEKLINDAGGDVRAFDIEPPDVTWHKIERRDHRVITEFDSSFNLFMCWPPYWHEPSEIHELTGDKNTRVITEKMNEYTKRSNEHRKQNAEIYDSIRACSVETVELFQGSHLVYVGEWQGCTGCDEFHKYIEEHFDQVEVFGIPQWDGLHDLAMIFKRKPDRRIEA